MSQDVSLQDSLAERKSPPTATLSYPPHIPTTDETQPVSLVHADATNPRDAVIPGSASSSQQRKRPRGESIGGAESPRAADEASSEEDAGLSLLFEASLLQQPKKEIKASGDALGFLPVASQPPLTTTVTSEAQQDFPMEPAAVTASVPAAQDTSAPSASYTHLDVLCGRGGVINRHYGNVVYRQVVEHNKEIYRNVPKRHRMLVSQSIVQTIMNRGGRFLSSQKSSDPLGEAVDWFPIHFQRAVAKTSQALREPPLQGSDAVAVGSRDNEADVAPDAGLAMDSLGASVGTGQDHGMADASATTAST